MSRARPKRRLSLSRAARIAAAAIALAAAVFGFAVSGTAAEETIHAIAAWQLFPLLSRSLRAAVEAFAGVIAPSFAGAAVAAGVILVLSAVFGRWYCAALCPLGTLQDIASFAGRRKRGYRKALDAVRQASAVAALFLALAGAMGAAAFIDPWSLFSRFMSDDVQPLVRLAAGKDIPGAGFLRFAIPAACMAAVLIMAILRGRWFCGTLCPVGGLLGLLNRVAPFRVRIDPGSCLSCGACSSRCPASCIDVPSKRLDASRCVNCLACVDACPTKALRYGPAKKSEPSDGTRISRKRFLTSLGGGAAAMALAVLPGKSLAARLLPAPPATVPPGAGSRKRFLETCTACGLCAAACPSKVLQPALGQLGARGLFAPRLDYSVSYCQFECKACSDLCPSGALRNMALDEKKITKIGNAELVKERCIVITKRTRCGACAEHCPTGAVRMAVGATGLPEPVFSSGICIGCGACHHACPAKPEKAITVSGLAVHEKASRPSPDLFSGTQDDANGGSIGGANAPGEFPF